MSTLTSQVCRSVVAAAMFLLLGGCAVTRIDVDVYKGPMANHADVQAEQLAALAMGARPLLIELRDQFDQISVNRDGSVAAKGKTPTNLAYRSDFMPPPEPRGQTGAYAQRQQWLVNQQAIQINAILSLYQDQTNVDIADLTSKAKVELENYRKSWEVYSNGDGQDIPTWKSFGLREPKPKPKKGEDHDKQYRDLYDGYKHFLIANGGIRYQWGILKPVSKASERIGANAKFKQLAEDDGELRANAMELFALADPKKPKNAPETLAKCDNLVKRVQTVSQAFLEARGSVQKLLHLSFDIADRVSVPTFPKSEGSRIKQACAKFIVGIIERTFLYVSLCEPDVSPKPTMIEAATELKKELVKKLGTEFFKCDAIDNEEDGSKDFEKKKEDLQEALSDLIVNDTQRTINALRQIDLAIEGSGLNNCKSFTLPKGSNMFGLARIRRSSPTGVEQQSRDAAIESWKQSNEEAHSTSMAPPPPAIAIQLADAAIQTPPVAATTSNATQPATSVSSSVNQPESIAPQPLGIAKPLPSSEMQPAPQMTMTQPAADAISPATGTANTTRPANDVPRSPNDVASHIGLISDDGFLRSLSDEGTFQSGVGLEGGRLNDGLVTAINIYLDAARRYDQTLSEADKKTLDAQRRSLVRQLIHFGEKLIFIADNQFLLTRDHDGVSQEYGDLKTRKEFIRAASVLETIGNSILVAANELYERDDYRTNRDSSMAKERVEAALKEIHLASGAAFREKVVELIADPMSVVEPDLLKAQSKAKDDADVASKNLTEANAKKDALANQVATDDRASQTLTKEKGLLSGDLAKDGDVLPILDEVYGNAPKRTSPANLLDAVKEALRAKYDKAADADSRDKLYARLEFVTRANPDDPKSVVEKQKANQLLRAAITASPDEAVKAASDKLKKDQDAQTAANTKFDDATKADSDTKQALDRANKAVEDEKTKKVAALNLVLKKFDALEVTKVIKDAIKQALNDMATATTDAGEKKAIQDAIDVLSLISVPDSINIVPNKNNLTPRDAMDDLLVNLRLQHVNAVQQFGAGSKRVQQLEAAIHVAELYRSDMVYIRPPAAYLRTSNVATVFQQGGRDLEWQNLLMQQGFRSTPIFGNTLDAAMQKNPDYEAVRSIDRQFWQNINSIRVAGSGITNYVITKDDIGNWYVKNYAGNPKPIIDAAKSMALFNAGNALGGPSAANRALQLEKNPDAPPQSEADLQIAAFTSDYNTATTALAVQIAGSGSDKPSAQSQIDTALQGAWDKDTSLSDVKDQLKGVQTDAEKPSSDIAKDAGITDKSDAAKDAKLPDEILTTLKNFKAYQDRLLAGVDNLHLDNSKTIQDKRQALAKAQSDQAAALAKAQAANASSQDVSNLASADADVAAKQGDLNSAITTAQQQISSAKADVITSFSGILNPLIQKRLDTVSTYSSALGVLRKANEAKTSPTTQKSTPAKTETTVPAQ